jgi:hypothetical protein
MKTDVLLEKFNQSNPVVVNVQFLDEENELLFWAYSNLTGSSKGINYDE